MIYLHMVFTKSTTSVQGTISLAAGGQKVAGEYVQTFIDYTSGPFCLCIYRVTGTRKTMFLTKLLRGRGPLLPSAPYTYVLKPAIFHSSTLNIYQYKCHWMWIWS